MTEHLDTWAERRIADLLQRELGHSLEVSPTKPLGSQGFTSPWAVLKALCRLWRLLRAAHLAVFQDQENQMWWVYIWHTRGLSNLLSTNREVLSTEGWPLEPEAFVRRSRQELVKPMTPLFDVIAEAYGDKLNPGRTDVLPGTPRSELFEAMERAVFPDPSRIYFTAWEEDVDEL